MLPIEKIQRSTFSPGPVNSSETLARLVYSPEHFSDGKLLNAAIPKKDLSKRGFSVQRKDYLRPEVFISRRDSLLKDSKRQIEGIGEFNCGDVRSIKNDRGEQALMVRDEAHEKDDEAHACIKATTSYTPSELSDYRNQLCKMIVPLKSEGKFLEELR